jgi:hypothetical protein
MPGATAPGRLGRAALSPGFGIHLRPAVLMVR